MKTSLKLSKLLKENGFELESEWIHFYVGRSEFKADDDRQYDLVRNLDGQGRKIYHDELPAYDILNDLCVKYAKEVFGEEEYSLDSEEYKAEFFIRAARAGEMYPEDETWGSLKGHKELWAKFEKTKAHEPRAQHVIVLLQQGKQDEAEAYLWDQCLYNPDNK